MALAKSGYRGAYQGTAKVKIALDANGQIAPEGTTAAGMGTVSISKVSAENGRVDNTDVFNFFLGLVGGRQDSDTSTMTVSWNTTTGEIEPIEP